MNDPNNHVDPRGLENIGRDIAGALDGLRSWMFNENNGDEVDRNPAQDKLLTKGEIKKLKDAGIDPEKLKGKNSGLDLFKDKKGNICVKPKGGQGPGDPTGININDL